MSGTLSLTVTPVQVLGAYWLDLGGRFSARDRFCERTRRMWARTTFAEFVELVRDEEAA